MDFAKLTDLQPKEKTAAGYEAAIAACERELPKIRKRSEELIALRNKRLIDGSDTELQNLQDDINEVESKIKDISSLREQMRPELEKARIAEEEARGIALAEESKRLKAIHDAWSAGPYSADAARIAAEAEQMECPAIEAERRWNRWLQLHPELKDRVLEAVGPLSSVRPIGAELSLPRPNCLPHAVRHFWAPGSDGGRRITDEAYAEQIEKEKETKRSMRAANEPVKPIPEDQRGPTKGVLLEVGAHFPVPLKVRT